MSEYGDYGGPDRDVDDLTNQADELNLNDQDSCNDYDDEIESYDDYPDPTFRNHWDPFPDMGEDDVDMNEIDECCQMLYDEPNPEQKQVYIKAILQKYLDKYDQQYSGWPEKELMQIVNDAADWETFNQPPPARSPEAAELARRYIFDDLRPKHNDKPADYWCWHEEEMCCCWFNASPTAGIAGFPERRMRDRKACISFVHNLMVELLIYLTAWGTKTGKLAYTQQKVLEYAIIGSASPKDKVKGMEWDDDVDTLNNDAEADVMDPAVERYDFLYNDSILYDMGNREKWLLRTWDTPSIDDEEDGEDESGADENDDEGSAGDDDGDEGDDAGEGEECNEKCTVQCEHRGGDYFIMSDEQEGFIKLLATLGRRCIAVAISRWKKTALFERRQPSSQWEFGRMMQDVETLKEEDGGFDALKTYIREHPRGKLNSNIFPIRVIDLETLEFEDDRTLFAEKYAILSHTWNPVELLYDTVKKVLKEEKEQKVQSDLAKAKKLLAVDLEKQQEIEEPYVDLQLNAQIKETQEIIKSLEQELAVIKAEREKEQQKRAYEQKQAMKRDPTMANRAPARDMRKKMLGDEAVAKETVPMHVLKLRGAIKTARDLKQKYLWIDNCCINKTDVSETAESISSMAEWYKNADVCITYLQDFEGDDLQKAKNLRWATRGWTLQELVMSRRVIFYNNAWKQCLDTNQEDWDREKIAKICRVPARLIACGGRETERIPAATILALAADRTTTKPEDSAYALMGLLNVRITPDYGEKREKALQRLIDAVIRTHADISVFNWTRTKKGYPGSDRPGKSLYPVDVSGYSKKGIKVLREVEEGQKLRDVTEKKLVIARSEVTLGTSGVNARFDVWQPRITVEGDNEAAYNLVKHLKVVQQQLEDEGKPHDEIQCAVTCTFHNEEDSVDADGNQLEDLDIKVFCTLDQLEKQLRVELGEEKTLTSAWVLARFSRAYGANWFLAALEFDPKLCDYGLFKDRFSGQKLESDDAEWDGCSWRPKIGDFKHFMHYMESDGFPAKRLETAPFKRDRIPMDDLDDTDDKYIKNINLWVG